MNNIFTVDLEDWFCAYNLRINVKDWNKQELRVERNATKILNLLKKYHVTATFFVLGWIAERVPALIKEIEAEGHEIATHGYSHTLITLMNKEDFELDIKRSLEILGSMISQTVIGFRAPSFTITGKTMWAIPILKDCGIKYDSSVYPIGFHPDYGIAESELGIHNLNGILEVPLSVAEIFGKKIPCSGGAYFRIFPYQITRILIEKCNKQGRPVIFYVHPWELDADQPRQKLSFSKNIRHYTNLNKTESRLEKLLSHFKFQSMKETLNL